MLRNVARTRRHLAAHATAITMALVALPSLTPAARASAQQPVQQSATLGALFGHVVDQHGEPIAGAEIVVDTGGRTTRTRPDGDFALVNLPPGPHTIHVLMLGFHAQAIPVNLEAGRRTTQEFAVERDPLRLSAVVVTGTQAAETNMSASVAITTLSPEVISQAAPRSTTEMLRYVPGFTRVESSGGEVNENISMRGILGVEYVMFMEDGMPVFPTMHTFFMNADNLFRPDENIAQMEVVRGGSSALFGSNTPGAIVNFINKTGGAEIAGTMKASAGTEGLARYDFNLNGPLSDQWKFNVGGFYRYDRGVRDPGFPGIHGGQIKASLTRTLEKGYVRATVKAIDDRNQFILDLPFQNPSSPRYVSGFTDYGSFNTNEGNHISVPTPGGGKLELPLDDGLRTRAYWLTADAGFEPTPGWKIQNTAQVMSDQQGWNAIVPFDARTPAAFINDYLTGTLHLPAGTPYTYDLTFTNLTDATGKPAKFNTANNLIAPGGEWHVDKPLAAFQNQLQLKRSGDRYDLNAGIYFANYSQTNHWFFTDVLTNVADQTHFLDLVIHTGGTDIQVTKNGFRNFLSTYVNGEGQTTISSGTIGGDYRVTDRLKVDGGIRYEYDSYVQSAENTSAVDLDGNAATRYDQETWGNGTFRHLNNRIEASALSLGANYELTDHLALYGSYSRAFKMPALDEFLNAQAEQQVQLFSPQRTKMYEGGAKFSANGYGLMANLFHAELNNITTQGAVTDPVTGNISWLITHNPQTKSNGLELEASGSPLSPVQLMASGTFLKATYSSGADLGSILNGVPKFIGNGAATLALTRHLNVLGDIHFVGKRYSDFANGISLPAYEYVNFGAGYTFGPQGITINADVLNAFQSTGLEEGNPRLSTVGGATSDIFLARPLLPRRVLVSMKYDF